MSASTKTWLNNNPPSVEDDDLNGFAAENNNLILGSSQALNTADAQQTHKAVSVYAHGGNFYTDGGAADAYVLSVVGAKVAPPAYFVGMEIIFTAGNTNTGASTVNVATLGVVSLKDADGNEFAAGGVLTGVSYSFRHDGVDFISSDQLRADLANDTDVTKGSRLVTIFLNWVGYVKQSASEWFADREPSVHDFGGAGDGVTDDRGAIALADINGTFIFLKNKTYRVSSNITITNNVTFEPGSSISVDTGVTVTINGLVFATGEVYPFGGVGTTTINTVTVNVPVDFATIQLALDACPRDLYQRYRIEIATNTYTEDLIIRNKNVGNTKAAAGTDRLVLTSVTGIAADVTIGSILIAGCNGGTGHPGISFLTLNGETPHAAAGGLGTIAAYGSHGASVSSCVLSSTTGEKVGLMAYASTIDFDDLDFGTAIYNYGFKVKHGGIIRDVGAQANGSGEFINSVVDAGSGDVHIQDLGRYKSNGMPVTCKYTANGTPSNTRNGVVYDGRSGQIWGATGTFGPVLPVINIQSVIESLDRYQVTASGTASITQTNAGTVFATGATSGSVAQLRLNMAYSLSQTTTFSSNKDFSVALDLMSGVTDAEWVYSIGLGVGNANSIRFKGNGDTLDVVVNDGTGDTLTNMVATGYGGKHVLRAVFYPGKRCLFFDNGVFLGEISTGLPAGSLVDPKVFFDLRNTTATDRQMTVYQYEYKDMKVV